MFTYPQAQKVPAMFIFGDSLVDVGNNNHLKFSLNKADFPHCGINFSNKVITGRFSNGKNAADFLAEKVGLPTSPPYLSMISNKSNENFLNGVSFASGGTGIFDDTDKQDQSLSLTDYFSDVNGELQQHLNSTNLQQFLSKSLFPIVIGSNDIFAYFRSSRLCGKSTPREYVDSMALALNVQLKKRYIYRDECDAEINSWRAKYIEGLKLMLQTFQSEFNYSHFDTNSILTNLIDKPASYGFIEVKTACCGLGHLRAVFPCEPFSACCPNRNDDVFWDAYHPTEAAAHIIVDNMYHDASNYSFPMN
ncbi:hypothetical protein ACB092_06G049400 [Castanea dentata]